MTDYRAVPLDVLREFAREQSERTSLRQVAAASGVGRTTLHKFVYGETTPHPRIRRLLALWYLRERSTVREDAVVEGYAGAVELLLSGLPEPSRVEAWPELLSALERLYETRGTVAPAALSAVRERGPGASGLTP